MALGFHVSKTITINGKKQTRGMVEALNNDLKLLIDYGFARPCAQIFVTGPQSFTETLTSADKVGIKRLVENTGLLLVVHGSYADNPWSCNEGSINNIKREMRIAAAIGATGVIIHMGKGLSNDNNIIHVLSKLSDLPANVLNNVILWLEIHVAKPSIYTYETPVKLAALMNKVTQINENMTKKGPSLRIGLCIDTAHLFSCGSALMSYDDANEWLTEVNNSITDMPIMLHLNDSDSVLGSGIDKHAGLTRGNLWGNYNNTNGSIPIEKSGLICVLNWAEKHNITTILERDYQSLRTDLALIKTTGHFQN